MPEQDQSYWLSPYQANLYQLRKTGGDVNAVVVLRLPSSWHEARVRMAVQDLIQRHEVLRTVYRISPGMKVPFQVVLDSLAPEWFASEDEFGSATKRPFAMEDGPIVRVSLIGDGAEKKLLLSLPSLACDPDSLRVLSEDLLNTVQREGELLQFAQVAQWQRDLIDEKSEDCRAGEDYWRQIEATAREATMPSLPFEVPAPATSDGNQFGTISADVAALDEVELLAVWQVLLWRLTGRSDVEIMVLASGREYEELQNSVGLIGKFLPVQVSGMGEALPFADLAAKTRDALRKSVERHEYFSGSSTARPFGFEFLNLPDQIERLTVASEPFRLKLTGIRRASGTLELHLQYDAGRVSRDLAEAWLGWLRNLIGGVQSGSKTAIGRLPLLDSVERKRVLENWNQTAKPNDGPQFVHEWFEQHVASASDRMAVKSGDRQLTYGELNTAANRLAHGLRREGVTAGSLVGLSVAQGWSSIVGLLGILKAGGAYVPLRSNEPHARLSRQLQGVSLVVTDDEVLPQLPASDGRWKPLVLDRISEGQPGENPSASGGKPDDLVYVIFTSGSTGEPKGVGVRHRNLVNYGSFVQDLLELHLYPKGLDFATVSTLTADLGNTCVFGALMSGGGLHVIGPDTASDAEALGQYISANNVDVLKIVPSHLEALLDAGLQADGLPRKWLVTGGETLRRDVVLRLEELGPSCQIVNHYGPTETTVGSLAIRLRDFDWRSSASTHIPIGRPIANTRVYIVDTGLEPVPVGLPGELCVAGAGVSAGYLGDQERTDAKFVADPFSGDGGLMYRTGDQARWLPEGVVEFLGRADEQVKIRGYRIELGEIEAALARRDDIKRAVVIARPSGNTKRLLGYVTGPKDSAAGEELRNWLRAQLPEYMIPEAVIVLDKLPLTSNGKVDRGALPDPETLASKRVYEEPKGSEEESVAEIWRQVLGRERVGALDNFFDIGGHSLLATQIASRLRAKFHAAVAVRMVFDHPTVRQLAAAVVSLGQDSDAATPIPRRSRRS